MKKWKIKTIVGVMLTSMFFALPARAWYNPMNWTKQDGTPAKLVQTTPYLPVGAGNCSIYPYYFYGNCVHPAYDIASSGGSWWIYEEPVHSVEAGTIIAIDPDSTCGLDVAIEHANGIVTRYCHLSWFADIQVGKLVAAREVIGYLGKTGTAQPHLHFEAHQGRSLSKNYVDLGDPLSWPTDTLAERLTSVFGTGVGQFSGPAVSGFEGGGVRVFFNGGSIEQLEAAAAAVGATAVWLPDSVGTTPFLLLVVGGPEVLKTPLRQKFPRGFSGPTEVTLR